MNTDIETVTIPDVQRTLQTLSSFLNDRLPAQLKEQIGEVIVETQGLVGMVTEPAGSLAPNLGPCLQMLGEYHQRNTELVILLQKHASQNSGLAKSVFGRVLGQ